MRRFLLGTDWWTDCDDAVALRLLARAHKRGEIALVGVGINACMPLSAASVDAFLRAEGLPDMLLGLDRDATDFTGRPPFQAHLAASFSDLRQNADVESAVRLYRRLLAEAAEPLEIIEIGFLQVVAAVLQSEGDDISPQNGVELFRQKVKKMWVMAGKWDEQGGLEHNFCNNARACRGAAAFCQLCPVPVTFLGYEVGEPVISGGGLADGDTLLGVLTDHGSPNGRNSWDPMTALLAVIGDEQAAGYRVVRGTASVDAQTGANFFAADDGGPHAYVIKERPDSFYADAINARVL